MSQRNRYKGTFKQFAWTILIFSVFSGIFPAGEAFPVNSAFAAPPDSAEGRQKATEELLSVAKSANVEEVTRLIYEGANVNAAAEDGMTPLMSAVRNNPIFGTNRK